MSFHGVRVVSPNIIKDKEFRRSLKSASTSADEAFLAVKDALENNRLSGELNEKELTNLKGTIVTYEKDATEGDSPCKNGGDPCDGQQPKPQQQQPNSNIEVKVKLFLRRFSSSDVDEALEAIDNRLSPSLKITSLQLAVPSEATAVLAIGAAPKPKTTDAYKSAMDELKRLWRQLEDNVKRGEEEENGQKSSRMIGELGMCDVETETLVELYKAARVKPTSVTVNLRSCCAVPEDLQQFASDHSVNVLTHSDPEVMIEDEKLRTDIKQSRYGGLSLGWVVRYQLMDTSRGVLLDKRYIVNMLAEQ